MRQRAAGGQQSLFPMRSVVLGAMLPAFLYALGMGAVVPILAPFAVERGASLALAAVVVALTQIGQMLSALPAGALVARIGERASMIIAGFVASGAFLAAGMLPSLWMLGLAVLLAGASGTIFQLARHSYLADITPVSHRARVLSTLAGVNRVARFIGPFLGAAAAGFGTLGWVFLIAVVTAASAAVTVLLAQPSPQPGHPDVAGVRPLVPVKIFTVISNHREVLATLGTSVALAGVLRGAKRGVIPLWGEYLGLEPATIALIYGLANGVDMLLFYPAGKLMDTAGRLWVAVPSMLGLAVAMALLPLTQGAAGLAAVAVLLGLANGIGAGIMMTIAADAAPADSRPQFLSAWRLISNLGSAAGPLVLAAGAAWGSVAAGVWATSLFGPAASLAMVRWLPRFSDRSGLRRPRKHR